MSNFTRLPGWVGHSVSLGFSIGQEASPTLLHGNAGQREVSSLNSLTAGRPLVLVERGTGFLTHLDFRSPRFLKNQ